MHIESILGIAKGSISISNGLATSVITGEKADLFIVPNHLPLILVSGQDIEATESLIDSIMSASYHLHERGEVEIILASNSSNIVTDGTDIKRYDNLHDATKYVLKHCEERASEFIQKGCHSVRDYITKTGITPQHKLLVLDLDTCTVDSEFRKQYDMLVRQARVYGVYLILKSKNTNFSDEQLSIFNSKLVMQTSVEDSLKLLNSEAAALLIRPDYGIISSESFKMGTVFNYVPLKLFNVRDRLRC